MGAGLTPLGLIPVALPGGAIGAGLIAGEVAGAEPVVGGAIGVGVAAAMS